MKLIVGLGNIGKEYEKTRHNVGFMLVDELASKLEAPAFSENEKFKAQVTEKTIPLSRHPELDSGSLSQEKIVLAKPTTFMNLSGEAVGALAHFYKLDSSDIWVLYDEVDLAFGKLRIRRGGGSAGHNGIKSSIDAIGEDFVRFRFGVGTERHPDHDTADYVLGQFTKDEQIVLEQSLKKAVEILASHLETEITDTTYDLK